MHGSLHLILAHESARARQHEARDARRVASIRRPFAALRGAGGFSARHPPARCTGNGLPHSRSARRRIPPRPVTAPPGSSGTDAAQRGVGPGAGCATMEVVSRRVSSERFVGRSLQLDLLSGVLERATQGRPSFAFVGGESGVGKTRLLREFESRAVASGARVLLGQCLELGGAQIPYAPLVGALRPLARSLDAEESEQLPEGTRNALSELLPDHARVHAGGARRRGGGHRHDARGLRPRRRDRLPRPTAAAPPPTSRSCSTSPGARRRGSRSCVRSSPRRTSARSGRPSTPSSPSRRPTCSRGWGGSPRPASGCPRGSPARRSPTPASTGATCAHGSRCSRGDLDATAEELEKLCRLSESVAEPQWIEPRTEIEVELALRGDRLDDARAVVLRAAPRIAHADEATRLLRMAWMAQRVEAEAAGRARALGEPYEPVLDEVAAALRERAEARPRFDEACAWGGMAAAELARRRTLLGDAPADAAPWEEVALAFDAISLPLSAAYARFRAGEALVTAGDRAAAAVPLRAAAAVAAETGVLAHRRGRRGARAPRAHRPERAGARHSRARARRLAGRPARPHAARARGPAARGRGPHEPRDRRDAVHEREDGIGARLAHPRQARRPRTGRGRRGRPPPGSRGRLTGV